MKPRVLVIDDDELMLISLEELLASEGLDVATAASGADALEKAGDERFDIVVLDLVMPGMSGFEVCRALRGMEGYRNVPIVMLTAKSGESDRKMGLEAGSDRFLPKPTDPSALVAILKELTSGKLPGSGGDR
jgi:DNA-binding response OmpR family regulator